MRSGAGAPLSCLYLISWIFLGNFMILNLFLAILLDSFTTGDEDDGGKDLKSMINLTEVEVERQERKENTKELERVRALRGVLLVEEYIKPTWDPGSKKASLGGGKKKKGRGEQVGGGNMLDESFELDTKSLVNKGKSKSAIEPEFIMF
jgi:hypothetical protein